MPMAKLSPYSMEVANNACTGQVGGVAIFKHISGFEFVLLPGRFHDRAPAGNVVVDYKDITSLPIKLLFT